MQGQDKTFGLIGYPLGHSYSRSHFQRKFELEGLIHCHYENFEIPSLSYFNEIITDNSRLVGLNVTIPYKQDIIRYLDEMDSVAQEIGAVNTIKINRSESSCHLAGYNTDVTGFTRSLAQWPLTGEIKAIVFGTGGSSLAIKFALKKLGIEYISVSRKKESGFLPYESLTKELAAGQQLWINCTPVGMFPKVEEELPLPYQHLTAGHFLFDLIYNPGLTRFLQHGVDAGSSVMNGSTMLYEQAEASWEIWTGSLSGQSKTR
jgi:shikimate dehydrogenase